MDPLWGPKHLRSSCFCESSLHTEFQSNSTSPSIKIICKREQEQQEQEQELQQEESQQKQWQLSSLFALQRGPNFFPERSKSGKAPTLVPICLIVVQNYQ